MPRESIRDREHLIRLALVLVLAVVVFLIVRSFLVPEGFGKYGHYRAEALAANRTRPPQFAGQAACGECHEDVVADRAGSRHERIACEACHWTLAGHAADPSAVAPKLPDAGELCRRCHEENAARPAGFPQVDPAEHAGDTPCTECHRPHRPQVE
jgi:hypothetical protein